MTTATESLAPLPGTRCRQRRIRRGRPGRAMRNLTPLYEACLELPPDESVDARLT